MGQKPSTAITVPQRRQQNIGESATEKDGMYAADAEDNDRTKASRLERRKSQSKNAKRKHSRNPSQ